MTYMRRDGKKGGIIVIKTNTKPRKTNKMKKTTVDTEIY